jgi:hypothetical protein
MDAKHFFSLSPSEQATHFHEFKREIGHITKKCLWTQFHRMNDLLVVECISFVLEKLVIHHSKIEDGKGRSFIYSIAKRYFQEWFFDKNRNANTIFIEDLLTDDQKADTIKYLKFEESNSENELNELKTETVLKFHELIRNLDDKNALLVLSALIECILTQDNYNSQIASLFLYRITNLKFHAVFDALKKMNLRLALSRPKYFENCFEMYKKIEPNTVDTNNNKIITDWEKRAICHFENRHERFRSVNYDARHNRSQEKVKVKSTPHERIQWIRCNPNNSNLEKDYYEKFGMSYRTFKSDKRMAYN